MTVEPGQRRPLIIRLTIVALVAVLLQIVAVSQITFLQASADLLPLVVAAVGLLCGSMTGAVFGFGLGLFGDVAGYQLVGLSSLAYLAVGFWAGRLRELRDPQAPTVPMAVGAVATLGSTLAIGLMRLLLGIEVPASAATWLLVMVEASRPSPVVAVT